MHETKQSHSANYPSKKLHKSTSSTDPIIRLANRLVSSEVSGSSINPDYISYEDIDTNPILLTNSEVRNWLINDIYNQHDSLEAVKNTTDKLFNNLMYIFYEEALAKCLKYNLLCEEQLQSTFFTRILGFSNTYKDYGWRMLSTQGHHINNPQQNFQATSCVLNNGSLCWLIEGDVDKPPYIKYPSGMPNFHFVNSDTADGAIKKFDSLDQRIEELLNGK